jgi:hypothetical protein
MKRLFTILLLAAAARSVQGQVVLPPTPETPVSQQPAQDSLIIHPLREDLMAQIARDQQIAQQLLLVKLDKRNGFRDVTFGTHLKFFKKAVLEWKEGDDRNYRRLTDQLAINGMPLTEIVYGFYKNRLHHIYLTAPGIENSRQMLQFFQSVYGPGERVYEQTVEFDNMIQWTGKKVILTYSEVASKKEGFFHFFVIDSETPRMPVKKSPTARPAAKKTLSSNKPAEKTKAVLSVK